MNRGWRFCRPLPYHLATAPVGIELYVDFRPRLEAATTADGQGGCVKHVSVRLGPDTIGTIETPVARDTPAESNNGAGNGIRTRDFDLGKVALYH